MRCMIKGSAHLLRHTLMDRFSDLFQDRTLTIFKAIKDWKKL